MFLLKETLILDMYLSSLHAVLLPKLAFMDLQNALFTIIIFFTALLLFFFSLEKIFSITLHINIITYYNI